MVKLIPATMTSQYRVSQVCGGTSGFGVLFGSWGGFQPEVSCSNHSPMRCCPSFSSQERLVFSKSWAMTIGQMNDFDYMPTTIANQLTKAQLSLESVHHCLGEWVNKLEVLPEQLIQK